jgi:hypothetical protein
MSTARGACLSRIWGRYCNKQKDARPKRQDFCPHLPGRSNRDGGDASLRFLKDQGRNYIIRRKRDLFSVDQVLKELEIIAHGMRLTEIFSVIKRFFGDCRDLAEKISVKSLEAS